MADNIILSSSVRNNLLSLQNTARLLETTQNHLATGLKVNSALDDPSAFFTASSLNSRANDLNRLLDDVGLAVQTLEAADKGIGAITDLVEAAQAAARNALQASSAVVTNASTTGTVGVSVSDVAATVSTSLSLSADAAATVDLNAVTATAAAATLGTTTGVFASTDLDGDLTLGGANQTLTIDVNGVGAVNIVIGSDVGADTNTGAGLVALIEAQLGVGTVTDGGSGALQVTAANDDDFFQFGGAAATTLGLSTAVQNPTDLLSDGIVSGQTITLNGTVITFGRDDGNGEVSTIEELEAAIDAISGLSATLVGTTLTIDSADEETDITVGGVGVSVATTLGLNSTVEATNLLNQISGLSGTSLTVQVGSNAATTISFGTGTSEVSTLAEFQAAISTSLVAGTSAASVSADGDITLTATSNADAIVIGGDAGALLGFSGNNVTVNPTTASLTNNSIVAQNDTLVVTTGSGTTTITFGTGTSEVDTLAELTTALGNISGISASIDSTTGYLTVSADSASTSFTLSGTGGPAAFGLSTAAQTSTTTANGTRAAAESQFNNLLTQINDLAADSSFNGNNLLTGDDLTVIFNEDGSSSLDISGVTFTSTGLGISAVTTGAFQTNTNINSTLSELDSAIATLRTQAATFGSNLSVVQIRQDFTRQLIDVLETGAGNLTLADTNREGANLLALQTRQQLSSTSLGIAARADQAVLQLLR
jgi:flagellin